MKYRRLTNEELQEMQPEFIQFLSSNTITADDWEKLKTESPQKVEQLIGIFSDVVFDKVLSKVEYLEFKSPKDIKTFHCQKEKIVLMGLRMQGDTSLDFTESTDPMQMLGQFQGSNAELKLYSAEKAYSKDRQQELFEMLENGALISKDGKLFNTLWELRQSNS